MGLNRIPCLPPVNRIQKKWLPCHNAFFSTLMLRIYFIWATTSAQQSPDCTRPEGYFSDQKYDKSSTIKQGGSETLRHWMWRNIRKLPYFPLSSIKPRSSWKNRTFIKWNIERNLNSIEPMARKHEENLIFWLDGFSIKYNLNPMIPHDSIKNTNTRM